MDMANENSRRIGVRDLLNMHNFSLTNAREKSDEFKTPDGKAIYFFWKQAGGINIAIDPCLPFAPLQSIPGVEFSKKNPYGIRGGSSMADFPREYQGFRPKNERSKVGRLFVIQQASFSDFMNTLGDIFSGKLQPKKPDRLDARDTDIAAISASSDDIDVGDDNENADSECSGSQGYEQDPEMRSAVKQVNTGRNEKMEQLYSYLASPQFAQRIRSMLESFETMRADLDAEKRAMQRIWAKRQSQIDRLTGSMTSVVGELQAIAQDQLPQLDDVLELEVITDKGEL